MIENTVGRRRGVEQGVTPKDLDRACLLCSEDKADACHRHFLTQYLQEQWNGQLDVEDL